jgi:hypothetical protein
MSALITTNNKRKTLYFSPYFVIHTVIVWLTILSKCSEQEKLQVELFEHNNECLLSAHLDTIDHTNIGGIGQ